MVSSTLVNVSDDAELRLVTFLCESSSDPSLQQQCSTYLSEGNIYTLLTTLTSSPDVIDTLVGQMEPITEVITSVSIISNMIQRLDPPEKIKEVLAVLIDSISQVSTTSDNANSVERKITILSVLYNMMDKSYKCMLLERMIQLTGSESNVGGDATDDLAVLLLQPDTTLGRLITSPIIAPSSNSNANLVQPTQPPIVNMLQSWNVSEAERRSMYSTISNVLPSHDIRQQRFLLLLIESYSKTTVNETTVINDDIIQLVKQVTINAIRDPVTLFREQRNLLSQTIVQETLQKQDTTLLALLTVFQEGTMLEYEHFLQTHVGSSNDDTATATLFSQWGLDHTQCVQSMRILSLCTLAIGQEVITYAEITKALHLNNSDDGDDVERWVIAAVNSGLLQAKMDQLQEMVMIERCAVRKFDIVQWKTVQSKLRSYKEQVSTVLNTLKQQQQQQQQQQQSIQEQ
jgi:translation initiation factor 3 subunit M